MEFPRWAIPAVATLAATGLVITACGQEKIQGAGKQNAGAQASPEADPSAPAEPAVEPATLEVASVSKLGKVVTDGEGRTLYRFDDDTARPPASTCADACAKAWPPVMATEEPTQVRGVRSALVGKVKRPDGKWQVTLNGWPLYRYAKDLSPGDVKGQGVDGTWFAAAPTGAKAVPVERANDNGDGDRWKGWTVLKAKRDPKFGLIVTDGKGRVMYRFDKDRPGRTTCFGSCKKAWPPVPFTNWKKLKLEGIDRKLVDFIERKDDGTCQVTINGWPMYYYAQDLNPGDTSGQGVGGVWWLVDPKGKKVTRPGGTGGY
ncbi:SCO0930 family lipoprotein [Spirillospora albida]|uniref:SCO0930 family lipoprotein n=1 Tax=Spirillospora albida TaxID=58123 RepID=UPI0004C0121E|nr:SCO0930 family lipoprotein [Spirillospora albida]